MRSPPAHQYDVCYIVFVDNAGNARSEPSHSERRPKQRGHRRPTQWGQGVPNSGAELSTGAPLFLAEPNGQQHQTRTLFGCTSQWSVRAKRLLANGCVEHGPGHVPTIRSQGATPQWGGAGLKEQANILRHYNGISTTFSTSRQCVVSMIL